MAKKNEKLEETIEIPDGIAAEIEVGTLVIKKDDKEIKRKMNPLIKVKVENNNVSISAGKTTKREKKNFGTVKAHINNMIKGLQEGFTYKLQAVSAHFPITVVFDKETNEILVKNFLGEKKDRKVKIPKEVEVNIDKNEIELKSFDIEKAGQTAANLEKRTRVRNKDRRIFQDGIFITEKPGRVFI
jgi:large subunit ribosomal protein L6